MLHHRKLAQHLCPVHLHEALIDFVPRLDAAHVPELVRVLGEGAGLHLGYVLDAGEEVMVFMQHVGYLVVRDGLGPHPRALPQLGWDSTLINCNWNYL